MGRADRRRRVHTTWLSPWRAARRPLCGASLPSRPCGRPGCRTFVVEHGPEDPCVGWRANDQVPPPGRYIGSPYDTEARYATKGATVWSGYRVHLTETCDDATPNLITNVETTTAAVSDDAVTSTIHTALDARGLLPTTHIADTGFVNAALFVDARERYGVDLIDPTRGDRQWQAQAGGGFAARNFVINFAQQQATRPAGRVSQSWTPALARGTAPVIKFAVADCRTCPLRPQCTRSTSARRAITIRPEAQHEALRVGRAREQTAEFAAEYARRAGVEGTIVQGVRSVRLRRTPYFGHAKTHLAHLMTAAAMNLVRLLIPGTIRTDPYEGGMALGNFLISRTAAPPTPRAYQSSLWAVVGVDGPTASRAKVELSHTNQGPS